MPDQETINASSASNSTNVEKTLWESFRAGDPSAFQEVYKRYVDDMFNYGMHLFMDNDLVEDSIQDVFIEIWNRKAFLGEVTSIKFYLLKALKNKVLRRMETDARLASQLREIRPEMVIEESSEVRGIFEETTKSTNETVRKAVDNLPAKQREIIEQRFYNGKSAKEISYLMKISIDSTYTLLSRAIQTLRNSLKTGEL